MIEMSTILCK